MATIATLQALYRDTVAPALKTQLQKANMHAVPRVEKIIINVGYSGNFKDPAFRKAVVENLARITGQQPVETAARKSISNFKIRAGNTIGAKVTLRGRRMYEFLEKLIHFTLPRVRDFRGLNPTSFDGRGNYAIGFKEHVVFPEVKPDEVERLHGLEVIISTTATTDDEGRALLRALGLPFAEESL